MNLSISHDSEVEAFAFPFLFLEVSPALDAINGYGKTKSNAFTTPNLKGLLVLEQKKKDLLIPLIFILPHILPDPTMAVYTAEPVADTLAVLFTAVMFGTQFKKALKKLENA